MTDVVSLDAFSDWYAELDEKDSDSVYQAVARLEVFGVTLGYPHSSAIKGSSIAMRELRVQSGGKPLRILYAFDPYRQAVLILGGDKTGDAKFYECLIPKAESAYMSYLATLATKEK
jgi:hypothetical protein